ncbi:prolyl aminopeptidase [Catenovulum sp. 2E275]|uniref:prolyl aminopeptidase n=1 Tax=Catenovulum sp. 2E275 TaxID=2980497 RepID=UPI0021D002A6|nr:prolyl aminopeptidase [Catenovulum sp. 2E275]MCU4676849.1 prolyl aminopeptidase [Catenovulum sp. 2E275]
MFIYPDIKTNQTLWLDTTNGHQIYVEESGNPKGYPVIYCHGGPGGASSSQFRRLFDPEFYRIIIFDQRGCGQSKPFLSLENNTTDDLIADIEQIRNHFKLNKVLLAGGSWGTTLALLYAQKYPQNVSAMLLRGIFLGRKQDLAWLYEKDGAARLFPDYYQAFRHYLTDSAQSSQQIISEYLAHLNSQNQLEHLAAAKAWCAWESQIAQLHYSHQETEAATEAHHALAMALLECHYFKNNCFIKENQILENLDKIEHIPAIIIHGRYDSVCDLSQAWQLHQIWQNSQLFIIPEAGHSLGEIAIAKACCQASNDFMKYFKEQK